MRARACARQSACSQTPSREFEFKRQVFNCVSRPYLAIVPRARAAARAAGASKPARSCQRAGPKQKPASEAFQRPPSHIRGRGGSAAPTVCARREGCSAAGRRPAQRPRRRGRRLMRARAEGAQDHGPPGPGTWWPVCACACVRACASVRGHMRVCVCARARTWVSAWGCECAWGWVGGCVRACTTCSGRRAAPLWHRRCPVSSAAAAAHAAAAMILRHRHNLRRRQESAPRRRNERAGGRAAVAPRSRGRTQRQAGPDSRTRAASSKRHPAAAAAAAVARTAGDGGLGFRV